jgi:hypothetical protein
LNNFRQTNRLLGFPQETRLLIINADDLGMCNSINQAIFDVLKAGVRSTSLMVTCPGTLQAFDFLKEHPDIPFGVHLTIISEPVINGWGPVTSREKVPQLLNQAGTFHNNETFPRTSNPVLLDQIALEFRNQIEYVLATGLKPSHLDWHSLRLNNRPEIFDLMLALAKEYGLACRVSGRPFIQKVQNQGLPCNDHDMLDSFSLDPSTKAVIYLEMLRALPAGLSEWAVHPGLNNAELQALEPGGWHIRQTDFDFWTSPQAQEIIKEQDIILIDYRTLQAAWRIK